MEATGRRPKVRTPLLPSIANFDDLDPLRREPGVDFAFLPPGRALPGDVDLVVLAGAKSTLSDLAALRSQGWDVDLHAHARRGGRIIGLCGGYQMLGRSIADPLGLEGPAGTAEGLGLLDVETVLDDAKTLRRVEGQLVTTAAPFAGYEIHLGRTAGPACARPLLLMADGRFDGAVSPEGRIAGAYVHGLFDRAEIRSDLLGTALTDRRDQAQALDADLDALASVLDRSLDFEAIARTAGL